MSAPSPFTQIVQMLSALLGGVWARLFLGRAQAAMLWQAMDGLRAFDELFARWKAGELTGAEAAEEVAREGRAVVRARTRGDRPAAPRRRAPRRLVEAPRRIIRMRPVNWAVIPRCLGAHDERRKVAVARLGEWSG